MLSVGITGSFGTGKTAVAKLLARQGAKVLDADEIAHRLIAPRGTCYPTIVRQFGKGILTRGRIDRRKLARIVFADPRKLKQLEKIIHPAVGREIQAKLKGFAKNKRNRIVAVEVPLLFESGLNRLVDQVIVVKSSREVQWKRLTARSNMPKEEIAKRIQSQMPLQEKIKRADFVVDNSGDLNNTQKQVREIWDQLIKKYV